MIDAVVWDMDGTLIDSSHVVPEAYIATVDMLGGPHYRSQDVIAGYSLGPPSVLLTSLLGRPCSSDDLDTYHANLRGSARLVEPYPHIARLLTALKRHYPTAVFTGASTTAARILLDAVGLLSCFDVVLGGDQVARPKPHPDGIVQACDHVGRSATRAIYIGDAPADLEAARRAGAIAAAAGWGHLYDPTSPADVVLHNPLDLLEVLPGGD